MQQSPKTSRMQNSYWVNYDRLHDTLVRANHLGGQRVNRS